MVFVFAVVVAVLAFFAVRRLSLGTDDVAKAAAMRGARLVATGAAVVALLVALLQLVRVVPAGHVGVVDLFGVVRTQPLHRACG